MSTGPLGITMARDGSGTTWLPDASPMYAMHSVYRRWELMLHGNAFLQYVNEGSARGASQLGLVNWFMGMANRSVGNAKLGVRAMFSAEPVTVGTCGYPDLLATGEFCHGEPLHDRQHPHDFFMEVAARYQRPLSKHIAFELYGGPAGEPALGPVAYPHRVSALSAPLATIGHHWQDATHISFGVATAGIYSRRWKLEGSLFNGREPDENRFDFDFGALDSYSGRVWFLPNNRWAFQASLGRLTEAEAPRDAGEHRADVSRATLSATHHQSISERTMSASTLVWGRNLAHGLTTDAVLLEGSVNVAERHVFFGRGEVARKSGEDLVIEDEAPGLADRLFTVGRVSIGYVRQFGRTSVLLPGFGAQLSVSLIPAALEPFYGRGMPPSFAIFASFRPRPPQPPRAAEQPMVAGMHEMATPRADHMPHDMMSDSTRAHGAHDAIAPTDSAAARAAIEFVTLLLSDPKVEARVHSDPRLHRLWSEPVVQRCVKRLRQLKDSGQPLPAACPAAEPTSHQHR